MAANAMLASKMAVAPAPAAASLKSSPSVVGFLQGRNQLAGKVRSQAPGRRGGTGRVAVRAASKDIFFGQDSRAAMQAGIEKLADSVGVTLGPRGTEHENGNGRINVVRMLSRWCFGRSESNVVMSGRRSARNWTDADWQPAGIASLEE